MQTLSIELFSNLNPFMENSYLVHDGRNAHIVDPGFSNEREWGLLFGKIKELKVIPEAIVLTHAHIDHIIGLQIALDTFRVPVYMHKDGLPFMERLDEQAMMFGIEAEPVDIDPVLVEASRSAQIGSFQYDVRHTPGHAPGHLSFYHEAGKWLLSGDTLFAGSIGRTDLWGGDFELLEENIKKKLYVLPDDTTVWPGHGHHTTIGFEKKNNPFVRSVM